MASHEKGNTKAQVKELTDRLEAGTRDVFTSDKYASYLQTMGKFHRYSTRNTLLIHLQKPDATLVAGFQAWQSKFGRYVKRGEKGIRILAPTPITIKRERQKLDPDTKRPILGTDGLPLTETVEERIPRFRAVSVFDVSQTDGKPLPRLAEELPGDVQQFDLFMKALAAVSPLPIKIEPLEGKDGACRYGREIAIREGMGETQTICAAVHEMAHALLHDPMRVPEKDLEGKDSQTKEVEAESVSYTVCQYYNIETSPNSFGYIAGWSAGRELKELSASLDVIRKTSAELIDGIDQKFRELAAERGIDRTIREEPEHQPGYEEWSEPATPENGPATPGVPSDDIDAYIPKQPEQIDSPECDDSEVFPDSAIGLSERDLFGYTAPDMLPLTLPRALELFEQDMTIYMLSPDNTEMLAFDRAELEAHSGIFGVDAGEWQESPACREMEASQREAAREKTLFSSESDTYGIYQLKDDDSLRYHRFTGLAQLAAEGNTINRDNYILAYAALLEPGTTLENLYDLHNRDDRPAAMEMRSMSISDVVALRLGGEITAHYVDSAGFAELPSFLEANRQRPPTYSQVGNKLTAESPEPDVPSAAVLEAQVKAGESISLMNLARAVHLEDKELEVQKEKPSIRAFLQDRKQSAAHDNPRDAQPERNAGETLRER